MAFNQFDIWKNYNETIDIDKQHELTFILCRSSTINMFE